MNWKDTIKPNPPQNVTFGHIENRKAGLMWELPASADDGDSAARYVVYRFDTPGIQPDDLDNPAKIINIEGNRYSIPGLPPNPSGPYYYLITSLDRNYNESMMSNIVEVFPPQSPIPAYPISGSDDLNDTVILAWNYPELASLFRLQVSTDSTFNSNIFLDNSGITDTFSIVSGLEGQTQYYWRINASNGGGVSTFSTIYNFTTAFPHSTLLSYPPNNTGNHPIDINLAWFPASTAESYSLQFAKGADFAPQTIVIDTIGLTDTTFALSQLLQNTFYFWRVKASNQFGNSSWTDTWRFKTINPVGVEDESLRGEEYDLEQNYPNPFNPITRIRFRIKVTGFITLKIYDVLGREVTTLISKNMNAGYHEFFFDASQLSSGIYIYRLTADNFSSSRKMILLK
jgi:hypothetical protein